jgi:hypothetical protein
VLVPQITGDALLLGAVKVKVSEAQSPMAPPVNEKIIQLGLIVKHSPTA